MHGRSDKARLFDDNFGIHSSTQKMDTGLDGDVTICLKPSPGCLWCHYSQAQELGAQPRWLYSIQPVQCHLAMYSRPETLFPRLEHACH